jgi:hypothetical protein
VFFLIKSFVYVGTNDGLMVFGGDPESGKLSLFQM